MNEKVELTNYEQKCRVLMQGISKEALEVLKELGHVGSPAFQFFDATSGDRLAVDAQVLTLEAAVRDGERRVVQTVLTMRARALHGK